MRALVAGGVGCQWLAQSGLISTLPEIEIAANESLCGLYACAVKTGGLQASLGEGFSLVSEKLVSSTVVSAVLVDVAGMDSANEIAVQEMGCSGNKNAGAGVVGMLPSFLMAGALPISAERSSSTGATWREGAAAPKVAGSGTKDLAEFGGTGQATTAKPAAGMALFARVQGVVRASKAMSFLCQSQVFKTAKNAWSLVVAPAAMEFSQRADTRARLAACSVSKSAYVCVKAIESAFGGPGCMLFSLSAAGGKSGVQWNVQ